MYVGDAIRLEFRHVNEAKSDCRTQAVKQVLDMLNKCKLSGVRCSTRQKLLISAISGEQNVDAQVTTAFDVNHRASEQGPTNPKKRPECL